MVVPRDGSRPISPETVSSLAARAGLSSAFFSPFTHQLLFEIEIVTAPPSSILSVVKKIRFLRPPLGSSPPSCGVLFFFFEQRKQSNGVYLHYGYRHPQGPLLERPPVPFPVTAFLESAFPSPHPCFLQER